MRYKTILLFGAPGSGKGTQGKIIGTIPGYFHFACGDAFRNLRIDSDLGHAFIEYSSKGQLVPDEHTIKLWAQNIGAQTQLGRYAPQRDVLVLDGIPRNPAQAKMLSETLDVRAIFYLSCADMSLMVERLQRRALRDNRLDDANLDVIHARLDTYMKETKPVLDYYGYDLVHSIDSAQTPVKVLSDILRVLIRV